MDMFKWPIDACIFLLDREPNLYTMKPKRREQIRLEVGCSHATMNRAIKAIKIREILIHSEISTTDLDKKLTKKNYILQLSIDRLKDYVLYLYRIIEGIKDTGEIPSFAGDLKIKAIDGVVGAITREAEVDGE